ncbi:MAG: 1-acyl-sn-glycerol-3-phosphate acyltransferase [Gammaproteobacteria bacterium]|nr:1-acyl-sn-glycerol-3-phosphate acyltransferase [Gammaproteobacteria bacterium]
MQLLRSLLFNIIMIATAVVAATIAVFTFPLPPLVRYSIVCRWGRLMTWLVARLCGIRYRVEGREHLPRKQTAILFSNHQSSWETLAFQQIFPPQVWVLKRELLWVPFFGWGLAMLEPIAINRGAGRNAVRQIVEQGRARLESGRWVVVFPEGTRVSPGHHKRFGVGGAVLAAETGHPVVPVAHNAGVFWPRRGFLKKPGVIRVVIGPTIHTHGKSAEEINREAEHWIRAAMDKIGREGDAS